MSMMVSNSMLEMTVSDTEIKRLTIQADADKSNYQWIFNNNESLLTYAVIAPYSCHMTMIV